VLRDPELYRYVPHLPPTTVASLEARYRRTAAGPDGDTERWWNWAVLRAADGAAMGTVETTLLASEDRALLAYAFGTAYWGFGYAFEACSAAIAHLRDTTAIRHVAAFVDTRNAHSTALLERLGFERKETVENADYFKGLPSNEYRYWLALLR
jgi:RimJ/RimL family protein N-acetyltransferase